MSTYLYGAEWNIHSSLAFGGVLAILYKNVLNHNNFIEYSSQKLALITDFVNKIFTKPRS